jgi:uncharacterized membrane protein
MAGMTTGYGRAAVSTAVTPLDRVLAAGAIAMWLAAVTAILRGHAEWGRVPPFIWAHLIAVLIALTLTPVMLLRRRGDARHRLLGKIWVLAMFLTALFSLGVQSLRPGHFTLIHLLSLYVIATAPVIWWSAATHRIALHQRMIRGMVTGALLIAGFFTFPFDRLLGHWLFS